MRADRSNGPASDAPSPDALAPDARESEPKAATEEAPAQAPEKPAGPTVVGIGASAGGLAALKRFLAAVPEESGLAYVVVVHLSPEHESHLAELLQPHTPMPVLQVRETVPLEADCVYVIPPGANLNSVDTHLRLSELERRRIERAPVDHFFRTLAATHDGSSIGVILTGTGSDGALGVREIKARNGFTVAQDPNEAEYDGMPQSAIATGMVDRVLPLAEIPHAVLRFARTEPDVAVPTDGEEPNDGEQTRLLHKILAQVRARTGRDFTRYKTSTLLRRIGRRMQLAHLEELGAYLERLREDADEVRALADEFLITVTNFFRDREVWEQVEAEIVPEIFEAKGPDDDVRVWSVGCATGEEAYGLAMLLLEAAERHAAPPRLQVFASDLHERSLERAREGFYPGDIEADVPPERLRRFFDREGGGYRIKKFVREVVVFAPHNLLRDPPFSRLDLVSCRNLLIYLRRDVQREVMEIFHYALRPEGTLVLGSSESIDGSELFRVEDKRLCMFRKRNVQGPEPRLPVFPLLRTGPAAGRERSETVAEPLGYGALHQRMVERYAPPSMLVSPDGKVVHLSEHAGRFLVHPGGEPTTNAFKLVRDELCVELRSALHTATEKGAATRSRPVAVGFDGERRWVTLDVRPAEGAEAEGFALVIFNEDDAPPATEQDPAAAASTEPEQGTAAELSAELELTRERLQSLIEEYETSQEEMRASNEELQSANEELRSTLEELETAKEELQSMNEELQTVNQQNRHKVEELSQLSADLQNLLVATEIATLFLDRQFRILRFTPRVAELFNIRPADRGRPLADFTHRLGSADLVADAEAVLRRLVPVEREIADEAGRWYLTRVLPYRGTEDRIEGVVITFVDITARKRAEEAVRESEERQAFLVRLGDALRPLVAPEAVIGEASRLLGEHLGADRAYYVEVDEAEGYARVDRDYVRGGSPSLAGTFPLTEYGWVVPHLRRGETVTVADTQRAPIVPDAERAAMAEIQILAHISTPLAKEGELVGAFCVTESTAREWTEREIELVRDVSERIWAAVQRARVEATLRTTKERMGTALRSGGLGVWDLNLKDHTVWRSPEHDRIFGYDPPLPEWTYEQFLEHVFPEDRPAVDEAFQTALARNGTWKFECRIRRADDQTRWIAAEGRVHTDPAERPARMVGTVADVTERKQHEEALRRTEERYRLLVESAREYAMLMLDSDGRITMWSQGAERIFGYTGEEAFGLSGTVIFTPEDRAAGAPEREMETAAREGQASDERWHLRKDGSRFWANGAMEALRAPDGGIRGFGKVLRDNTDRKRAEDALRTSEEGYRRIVATAYEGIWVVDVEGRTEYVNPRMAEMLGYTAEEMQGRSLFDFVFEADRAEILRARERRREGMVESADLRYLRKDGSTLWAHVSSSPYHDAQETFAGSLAMFTDITARIRAEAELRERAREREELLTAAEQARREAEAANQAKSGFMATLSHELRTPLNAVIAYADLLELGIPVPLPDPARVHVERIRLSSHHLTHLIEEMLTFSRLEAAREHATSEPVDVTALLREVAAVAEPLAERKGIAFRIEAAGAPEKLETDPRKLRQILLNLVGNAVKFTERGEIALRTAQENGATLFEVWDTGIGIAPEDIPRLFEPFWQASRGGLARAAGGTGLGLAITSRFAEMLGGSVEVESQVGEGSTFRVRLPLSVEAPRDITPA